MMWNTVEGLSKLFYASQWAMAVLGALTAVAIVFSIIVSVRKDHLVGEEERRLAEEHQRVLDGQNKEIGGLKTDLDEAQQKLRALSEQRKLSVEQRANLIAILRKSPPQETMIIRVGDFETQTFAEEIAGALREGGWTVLPTPFRIIERAVPGLMILVEDRKAAPIGAGILQNAFKAAGIEVPGDSTKDVEKGKFVLWVGPKPVKHN
jgi:hypothetical protein